jgi:plasmid replication initiation protein
MESIRVGQRVVAVTSAGRELAKRAASTVVSGERFRVVRICSDEEWEAAQREGREPKASAWPASAVRPA